MISSSRTSTRRKPVRAVAVASAVILGGIACLGSAVPATAADTDAYIAPYSSAQAVSIDVQSVSTPGNIKYDSTFFNAATKMADGHPLVGYTGPGGRHSVTTGLVYPKTSVYSSSVNIHVPVVFTTGIPSYSTSASGLYTECNWDGRATTAPTGSVKVSAPVPMIVPKNPAQGYTIYRGGSGTEAKYDMKIVYNEQTTLPNGQLQVIGQHVYFNVPAVSGSGAVTGDVKLGIATCGPGAAASASK